MSPSSKHAQGFTLIEVLVALIVTSVGLLGLAALETATVRFNQNAYLRSQATNLAYDLADRMRANREAALAGNYDSAYAGTPPACNAAVGAGTVAAKDLAGWRIALTCALPSGNGRIQRNNRTMTISVRWNESRGTSVAEDGSNSDEEFQMVTTL